MWRWIDLNLIGSLFGLQSSGSSGSECDKKKIVSLLSTKMMWKRRGPWLSSHRLVLVLFQESPYGEPSSEPKMEISGSAGGELSAPSGSGSKPGGAPVASFPSLPSKPVVKLDPPSDASKPAVPSSSLSVGDRSPIRRPASPMEYLIGSPRRTGDGGTRSTHLTSSDLLKGYRPYHQWE